MGTTSTYLEEMIKLLGIPNYRGYYMKDDLVNIKPKKYECLLVNLENHNQQGSHHTALYKKDNMKIYFDSFGKAPPEAVIKYMGKNSIICSSFQIQPIKSDFCGEFCVLVLLLLSKGMPYEEILLELYK